MHSPSATSFRTQAGFIGLNGRRLFELAWHPVASSRGTLLVLPALAEEMNRYRLQVATTARALAASGWHVRSVDPFGTGESEGRIEDGDWDLWLADTLEVARQSVRAHGPAASPLTLWAMRTGALLAADVAAVLAAEGIATRLLLWQPVVDGKSFMNQYLRLRLASQLVGQGAKETSESLRQRLAQGEVIEVAGYPLVGALATALESRALDRAGLDVRQRIDWIETVSKPDQPLPPAGRKCADALRAAGVDVTLHPVVAPPVWQLHVRVDAPTLVQASLQAMDAPPRAAAAAGADTVVQSAAGTAA